MPTLPFEEWNTIFKDSSMQIPPLPPSLPPSLIKSIDKILSHLFAPNPLHGIFVVKDEDLGYEPMKPSLQNEAASNQRPRVIPYMPANALLWTDNGRAPLIEFEEKAL